MVKKRKFSQFQSSQLFRFTLDIFPQYALDHNLDTGVVVEFEVGVI